MPYGDLNATDRMFVRAMSVPARRRSYSMARTSLSHDEQCGRCPHVKNGNTHASLTHSKQPANFAAK
ncbi:uncharacterized protein LAESUDRAFT_329264 [Laetiporus sulphureus 93-53]|uniref:Uncharacterized protein n=1 Tax=Laetiporus sulphureus 93-53 TaxID=1314785 RepID=A0A165CX13_9APHY|nr:uncharacterized protein LAESUDRAFT_329264 [Laetiporus sulphureus 93-53]KZT03626.1 hypothetical protein LAESUDRAFT_329264 [Laetiporus sulphureus 93-53]